MNVIFLDIDGVLNSKQYDNLYRTAQAGNIDETRLPLLKYLTDETGAVIVLTSSWRKHWNKEKSLCDSIGIPPIVLLIYFNIFPCSCQEKTPIGFVSVGDPYGIRH